MYIVLFLFIYCCFTFNLYIVQPLGLKEYIFRNDELNEFYDSNIFEDYLSCSNGLLQIIEFEQSIAEEIIIFKYEGIKFSRHDVKIEVQPNYQPRPFIKNFNGVYKNFTLDAGCPEFISDSNYYNRVMITIKNEYKFSFLLNCDYMDVHKKFQFGYILITILCTGIIFTVSLYPRIYSIRINRQPINIEIKWQGFLFGSILINICMLAIYYQRISKKDYKYYLGNETEIQIRFHLVNSFLRYLGLFISFLYSFVCFSQTFYQWPYLLNKILYGKKVLRFSFFSISICKIYCLIFSFFLTLLGLYTQNWLLYNILSCFCCIGCIKMFRFGTLKNATQTMFIIITTMLILLLWGQTQLERSYNDYTSDVSSPLFIEVPDLVNNLYRKCSWLSIFDIIIPGSILAYLRQYDQNFHEGFQGVYTYTSLCSYIGSMIIWILLEGTISRYIPFCLIGYPFLLISIIVLSKKRNEFKTIWNGYFHISLNHAAFQIVEEYRSYQPKQLNQLMKNDIFDSVKIGDDLESDVSETYQGLKQKRD